MKFRERPRRRKEIISRRLRPVMDEARTWDGHSVVTPDGTPVTVSGGTRRQIWRMIDEGYFSDENWQPVDVHFIGGVRFAALPDDEVLEEGDGLRILLIRPTSSYEQKLRASRVGTVANREMRYDFGVYYPCREDQEDDEKHQRHLLVVLKGDLAIALLIFERWSLERRSQAAKPDVPDQAPPPVEDRWVVAFVWASQHYRRQGIASRLVRALSTFAGVPIEELVWKGPFSDAGEAFMHSICPGEPVITDVGPARCE